MLSTNICSKNKELASKQIEQTDEEKAKEIDMSQSKTAPTVIETYNELQSPAKKHINPDDQLYYKQVDN